jgi:hypothetical protein
MAGISFFIRLPIPPKMHAIIATQREMKHLYKQFLRLHAKFPQQAERTTRFAPFLLNQIRYQFRNAPSDVERARRELAALSRIVEGDFAKGDSFLPGLRAFLPPKEQYTLLDANAQDVIKNPAPSANYFDSYVRGLANRSR